MAAATEPVLRGLKDPAPLEVLVLCLYGEVHHGVDHVLELVAATHLTGLVDLANDNSIDEMLLAVISNHSQGAFRAPTIGVTILVEPVVQALETVNNQEEGLPGICLAELVCVLQQCGNMSFLAGNESVTELKPFADQLDLEEAFLSSIENDRST